LKDQYESSLERFTEALQALATFYLKIISEAVNFSKIEKKAISDNGLNTEERKNIIDICLSMTIDI